jgi:hypothetical protein
MKAIQQSAPVAGQFAQKQGQQEKYPVKVIGGEWEGRATVRVTNNEKNFKFDAFKGGATKVKQLFATDIDGDSVMGKLAMFALQNGVLTKEDLVVWLEKMSQQITELIEDEFIPV